MNDVHFMSKKTDRETPTPLFDKLNQEFGFTLDVCATDENAKCGQYFTPKENGLYKSWAGNVCWMNPPYGRDIKNWVRKAHEEAKNGIVTVGLLPARTDTYWFHDYIYGKFEIRFLRGRINFSGHKNPAPFPSMIVVFR